MKNSDSLIERIRRQMSIYHIPEIRRSASPTRCTVRYILIENEHLIETVAAYQSRGRAEEATKYQQLLHRNLVTLAKMADGFLERKKADEGETSTSGPDAQNTASDDDCIIVEK